MGRPLKKETIVKMNLIVETKDGQAVLGKQVGFNKYIVDEEARKIVRLAKEIVADEDAVLALTVKGETEPVLKVLRNVVQTEKGVYAYKLNVTKVDGEEVVTVEFADAEVAFAGAQTMAAPKRTTRKSTTKTEEPAVEPEAPATEPEATEPEAPVEE